jgi:transposase InsO family protein
MTCFPLQSSRLAPTSIRRSVAPVRSAPPLETAIAPPREQRKDRQRWRQSSLSVMNAGDQACPETRPCPHPSPGDRKPARTLAGIADGTDVLLGNVEFQHRHAAQLKTHANAYCERLVGSIRRECLDFMTPLGEKHLRRILAEWVMHYNQGRPHLSLGPGTPEPAALFLPLQGHDRHSFARDCKVVARAVLGGLHHEYRWERIAA